MNKYIRINNKIVKVESEDDNYYYFYNFKKNISKKMVPPAVESIEELMYNNDLIIVYVKYDGFKKIILEPYICQGQLFNEDINTLKDKINFYCSEKNDPKKTTIEWVKIGEFYTKFGDNWKCIAKAPKNKKGKLELL